MGKALVTSRTFWLNILGGASMLGGLLPPKIGGPLLAIGNVLVRLITTGPISGLFR